MQRRRERVLFLGLLLAALLTRVAIIDRPFVANSEGLATGWVISSIRNHLRYGLTGSRLAGVLNSGRVPRSEWIIYSHHPPLTTVAGAVPVALAGEAEWSVRLLPALFSVATTALLFVVARRRFGVRVAATAGVLYAFCPMTLALGDMAEYMNAPLVFCGLATVASYARWIETGRRSWLAAVSAFFVLASLGDWPAFYLVPLLSAHAFLTRRATLLQVLPFVAAGALWFGLLAEWVLWSGGDVSVFHQLAVRTSARDFSVRQWIERAILHHQGRLHTWPLLVLAGVYVASFGRRASWSRDRLTSDALPLLLLAWGTINLGVGIEGVFYHEWWSLLLTPGLALSAALGLEIVLSRVPARVRGPRLLGAGAALAVLLFVGTSARTAYGFTGYEWFSEPGYTLKSIGSTMRRVSRETEGVLTSVDTDHPALWFYADRQLRVGVTSVEGLDAALGPGPYVVFYGYVQPRGPRPSWFVMPVAHRGRFPGLAAELDRRYGGRVMGDGMIYDLRESRSR